MWRTSSLKIYSILLFLFLSALLSYVASFSFNISQYPSPTLLCFLTLLASFLPQQATVFPPPKKSFKNGLYTFCSASNGIQHPKHSSKLMPVLLHVRCGQVFANMSALSLQIYNMKMWDLNLLAMLPSGQKMDYYIGLFYLDMSSRCPRMTGGVTLAMGRMTRSLVVVCGAAATLKPWGTMRAKGRTPAPRHRLRSRCDPTRWSRPSSDPETFWTPRGTMHASYRF